MPYASPVFGCTIQVIYLYDTAVIRIFIVHLLLSMLDVTIGARLRCAIGILNLLPSRPCRYGRHALVTDHVDVTSRALI